MLFVIVASIILLFYPDFDCKYTKNTPNTKLFYDFYIKKQLCFNVFISKRGAGRNMLMSVENVNLEKPLEEYGGGALLLCFRSGLNGKNENGNENDNVTPPSFRRLSSSSRP